MLLAGLLLAYTATTIVVTPIVLTPRRRWPIHHPRLALAGWQAAFASGGLAAVVAILILLVNGFRVMTPCDSTVVTPCGPGVAWTVVLGWASVFIAAASMAVASRGWEVIANAERRNRDRLLAAPGAISERGGVMVRSCPTSLPVACSLPGPEPIVVLSDGILAQLTPAQVDAVVAHERAHLRRHHHFAMRLAEVNHACLPRVPSARSLRRSTALLIELIADDVAAREVGAAPLADALTRLATTQDDPTLLLRAQRVTSQVRRSR